ncbi:hypothetical protein QLQ12_45420 [Actinoplanes sp. NEAU-A12]|uniref:Uncharacterized protein n=1 Tax=Actinoplanes sandaracinus TaxID=3045177 RepID=A0ABT6X1F1_9ACTN|nr:hypothetical protein [Actinoplanes sandaracinus]MDI6105837.1 hypothetical protein [Actinoplanes sandaracinus]
MTAPAAKFEHTTIRVPAPDECTDEAPHRPEKSSATMSPMRPLVAVGHGHAAAAAPPGRRLRNVNSGTVDFFVATFEDGGLDLSIPREWSRPPLGIDETTAGVWWPSAEHLRSLNP